MITLTILLTVLAIAAAVAILITLTVGGTILVFAGDFIVAGFIIFEIIKLCKHSKKNKRGGS